MHDSGKRQQFGTGAVRDTAEGKAPWHLMPPCVWHITFKTCYGKYVAGYLEDGCMLHLEHMFEDMIAHHGAERLAMWLQKGADKYEAYNYAKGIPISRCLDSLGRHLDAHRRCKDDEDHIAAAMCNVAFIIHFYQMACQSDDEELNRMIDDMPAYNKLFGNKENS